MDDRQLVAIIDDEFTSAMGAPLGDISTERGRAWDYYLSKHPQGEEGESSAVTSDVSDVVDGIMPSLMRIFTTSENLLDLDAVGPEDEPRARQESDYVNHTFFKQQPSFELLYVWCFDALVQKNGIVKAWWDDSETVDTESYEGLSDLEIELLLDDEELEPVERAERKQETVDESGYIVMDTVHDIVFRRVRKTGQVAIANVPPEEFRVSADARRIDPCSARMVGHERPVTRTELLEMGFDPKIVDSLPRHLSEDGSEEEIARYDREDESGDSARERSMDEILLREAYIRVDYDGDGRAELRQVFTAGNKVLSNEPVDRQPFHVITPQILPHKFFGRATAEKVMDVQDISRTLLRQVLQNLYHTNNPSHAVWEQGMGETTLDDLLTTRVGSIKRFSRPVGESYSQIAVPFTASATFPMLDYFEKVKRDRTGISSDSEGLDPDALKNIQQSVMAQASDLSRMKVELIARSFAETGIKSLFLHIHELLLKHQRKADVVKLRGEWVPIDPREWRTRRNVTINIGLGIGSRESNLMHLEAIWQKQTAMVQGGGMNLTVTPQNLYATASEIVKNANYKVPDMFFTDPGDQLAPPPTDEQQQLEQMQRELEQRRQQLDAQRNEINQKELELDRQRLLFETDRKGAEFEHKRQVEMADLMLRSQKVRSEVESAQTQSEVAAAKAEMDTLLARMDATLKAAQTQKTTAEALQIGADDAQEAE